MAHFKIRLLYCSYNATILLGLIHVLYHIATVLLIYPHIVTILFLHGQYHITIRSLHGPKLSYYKSITTGA